jgi:hypothetical protein
MLRLRRPPSNDRQRGQSLVEFALFLPIMAMLLLGIGELARIFTTMIVVESAAREAADWGAYLPGNWDSAVYTSTVTEMERRACTPTTALTEYAGASDGSTCTNPSFTCELYDPSAGATWTDCLAGTNACDDADHLGDGAIPCKLRVELTYTYDLFLPTQLLGLPTTITFTRTSVFNVADNHGT